MNRLRPLLRALACLAVPLLPGPAGAEETEAGTLGTGILGVVTGISSIHVNGLNIETPDGLMVGSRLGAQPASALRPGDTVIVTARRGGPDRPRSSGRAVSPGGRDPLDRRLSVTAGSVWYLYDLRHRPGRRHRGAPSIMERCLRDR